jgi:hypothetical protein
MENEKKVTEKSFKDGGRISSAKKKRQGFHKKQNKLANKQKDMEVKKLELNRVNRRTLP